MQYPGTPSCPSFFKDHPLKCSLPRYFLTCRHSTLRFLLSPLSPKILQGSVLLQHTHIQEFHHPTQWTGSTRLTGCPDFHALSLPIHRDPRNLIKKKKSTQEHPITTVIYEAYFPTQVLGINYKGTASNRTTNGLTSKQKRKHLLLTLQRFSLSTLNESSAIRPKMLARLLIYQEVGKCLC